MNVRQQIESLIETGKEGKDLEKLRDLVELNPNKEKLISSVDHAGNTLLHVAASCGNKDFVSYLIDKGSCKWELFDLERVKQFLGIPDLYFLSIYP